MRRIFVGDVQGCREELEALIAAVGCRAGDAWYCVGDLVNRGPDSAGVLRRVRDLGARVVLGNHDLHLLRVAAGSRRPSARDRFDGVLRSPDADRLIGWLAAQPVFLVENDLVVVHAGLHPAWTDVPAIATTANAAVADHVRGALDERIVFATEVRYCDAHGQRPLTDDPPPGPPFQPWDIFYKGERIVVCGHWARRGLVVGARLRALDTGCVYGGSLTAWIAEEDRIVQVDGWRAVSTRPLQRSPTPGT